MLAELLRLLAEIGPGVIWAFSFTAALIAILVAFVGIAMWATMRAEDPQQRKVCYQIFRDLLDLFGRGRRR